MPAAFDLDWQAIDAALIAGVSYQDVARSHGLLNEDGTPDTVALRKRVSRLDLPIPSRVKARAAQIAAEAAETGKNGGESNDGAVAVTKQSQAGQYQTKPIDLAAKSMVERVDALASTLTRTYCDNAEKALKSTPKLFIPTGIDDMHKMVSTVWKVTGRDKPGPTVSLSLFGSGSTSAESGFTRDERTVDLGDE